MQAFQNFTEEAQVCGLLIFLKITVQTDYNFFNFLGVHSERNSETMEVESFNSQSKRKRIE